MGGRGGKRGEGGPIPQRENDIKVPRLEIREPSLFTLFNLLDRHCVLPRNCSFLAIGSDELGEGVLGRRGRRGRRERRGAAG